MSAEINNREYRQQVLKDLISQLHDGESLEKVKEKFAEVFGNVSAEEIAQAEQAIISEGLPVAEVQRLCDVHAAVFKGSIDEIHSSDDLSLTPGHPAHTLKQENREIEKLIKSIQKNLGTLPNTAANESIKEELNKLSEISIHYVKKENLLFPYLEKYGITAHPKVMWGVDDEIREELKHINSKLQREDVIKSASEISTLLTKIEDMIFKEENILLPMLIENLALDEWRVISEESEELGYCLIESVPKWNPNKNNDSKTEIQASENEIILPTGFLKKEELIKILDTLPMDITFVDKNDTVKYFSQGAERIFPRTKSVIGRNVSNCHPPASVHIVEKIVEDFKAGVKDSEDFWIKMGDKYILIRYFAMRDENNEFLGVLEVTQNIKPIQEIQGEKRLVTND